MTPADELALYHRDKSAWARYVAPRVLQQIRAMQANGDTEALAWKRKHCGPELAAELKKLMEQ